MIKSGIATLTAVLAILFISAGAYGQAPRLSGVESRSPGGYVDIVLHPERPETGDKLKLEVKLHGGAIRAETRWRLNDEEIGIPADSGQSNPFVELKRPLKADDVIQISVTPYDALGEPGPTVSKRVVVANAGPNMKLERQWIDSTTYKAKVEVSDPEGEPIQLELRKGPEGMKINDQGEITWNFEQGKAGTFPVEVSAKDARGVEAILSYTFRIRWSTKQGR